VVYVDKKPTTPFEKRVLEKVTSGSTSTGQVARVLGVSTQQANNYMRRLETKGQVVGDRECCYPTLWKIR
jgi:DNA-binding CsgD family transcriptional regulator